jgi:hypothetical protein
MTKLPAASLNEAEMIAAVTDEWVQPTLFKMTEEYTREFLEAALCDMLRRGAIDELQVIEDANRGDEIADAALRLVWYEIRNRREEPSVTLDAYGMKTVKRGGPVTRGRGQTWHKNWRRNIGIAVLVYMTHRRFGLTPTRNREQRRRKRPSACSVVAAALGRCRINLSESAVQNIWGGLQGQIALYLLNN